MWSTMSQYEATNIPVAAERLISRINSECKIAILRCENRKNSIQKRNWKSKRTYSGRGSNVRSIECPQKEYLKISRDYPFNTSFKNKKNYVKIMEIVVLCMWQFTILLYTGIGRFLNYSQLDQEFCLRGPCLSYR
jgi:hypothetical protein